MTETPDDELAEAQRLYEQSHGSIEGHGHRKFAHLHGDAREEAVQEVRALAWGNYHRLYSKGRQIDDSLQAGCAAFAAKAVASGGRLVGQAPVRDAMNGRHGHSLGEPREHELADGADPAEQAIFNVDLELFLAALDETLRKVMLLLLEGRTNEQIGKEFGYGRGWGSLRRQELWALWQARFGEGPLS